MRHGDVTSVVIHLLRGAVAIGVVTRELHGVKLQIRSFLAYHLHFRQRTQQIEVADVNVPVGIKGHRAGLHAVHRYGRFRRGGKRSCVGVGIIHSDILADIADCGDAHSQVRVLRIAAPVSESHDTERRIGFLRQSAEHSVVRRILVFTHGDDIEHVHLLHEFALAVEEQEAEIIASDADVVLVAGAGLIFRRVVIIGRQRDAVRP